MMRSIFYVSRSLLPAESAELEVAKMVGIAKQRNHARGIGGALVFTGFHFAQFLEGAPLAIEALLMSIRNDKRHANIDIVLDERDRKLGFRGWDMAYAGPSSFVGSRVLALAEAAPSSCERIKRADAEIVVHLMQESAIVN